MHNMQVKSNNNIISEQYLSSRKMKQCEAVRGSGVGARSALERASVGMDHSQYVHGLFSFLYTLNN